MLKTDLILANAKIFDFGKPLVPGGAVALGMGRILAAGDTKEVMSFAGEKTEVIDLEGRVLLPGFFDSHLHLASFGQSFTRIDFSGAATLAEALDRVKKFVEKSKGGEWLLGRGWDNNLWDGKLPSRQDLDGITGNRPAAFPSRCGHMVWANSAALKAAGVTKDTPDPQGGKIERDAKGEPTGIFMETAVSIIRNVRPKPGNEATRSGLLDAIKEAHKLGITSVMTLASATEFGALCELEREGGLDLRVHVYIEGGDYEEIEALEKLGLRPPLTGDRLGFCGLKYYVDGSLGGKTAYMFEPYSGSEDCGIPVLHGRELEDKIAAASRAGIPCAMHAIGDRAVAESLDAIEASRAIHPGLRHRIEHSQVLRKEDIKRFAESGVIASMQPVHIYGDIATADKYWGERCRYAYALRSLIDSGAVVALGTDCPIERLDPMLGLFAACAREPEDGGEPWIPEERITLEEALWCYGARGAYAVCAEERRGAIAPGMDADLVVLRGNLFETDLRELLSTRVEMTVFAGRVVHRAFM